MVTYEALFAYTLVIIGIVSLVIQITKKEVTADPESCGYFSN